MIWLMPWDAHHPARHQPWATWGMIVANLLVFACMLLGDPTEVAAWFMRYGLIAAEPQWSQYLTANFIHAGWEHLLFNILFLYVLGDNVEDVLGAGGFLLLYFLGGLAGDALYVHANPTMLIPSVGASGCIAALAGGYAVMFFRRTLDVRVMFIVFPVYTVHLQAIWVLLLWFGMDLYLTLQGHGALGAEQSVNLVAHGVGFVIGMAVGVAALLHGAMRRFERLERGHACWGYWPSGLERRGWRRS